jgi:uncharacterized spore protein YtfJ
MDKVVEGPGKTGGVNIHQTLEDVNKTMETFIETASVDRVYGKPIEVGDTKIIPAAENLVVLGFGAGGGYGTSEASENSEAPTGEGGGGGGGGGGRTFSRPVAVIIATPSSIRIEPIFDRTKIAMAAVTAAGFMAGMLLRMTRGPR